MKELKTLECVMTLNCKDEVTHIDSSGFIYCESHGHIRKQSRYCRKMKPSEVMTLREGKQIKSY